MAAGDIKVKFPDSVPFSKRRNRPSGTANSIHAGEPTKAVDAAAASPYLGTVAIMVDGDGSTGQRFMGIAKDESTDTVAAAGFVNLFLPLPGVVYSAKTLLAASSNTQALVDALQGKRVVFDLTSTAWTIDAAANDAVANCVVIIGGDPNVSTVEFVYAPHGTYLDFAISA